MSANSTSLYSQRHGDILCFVLYSRPSTGKQAFCLCSSILDLKTSYQDTFQIPWEKGRHIQRRVVSQCLSLEAVEESWSRWRCHHPRWSALKEIKPNPDHQSSWQRWTRRLHRDGDLHLYTLARLRQEGMPPGSILSSYQLTLILPKQSAFMDVSKPIRSLMNYLYGFHLVSNFWGRFRSGHPTQSKEVCAYFITYP